MATNNQKMELENIKAVQEVLRQGNLSSLSANLKRLKLKLDQFSALLTNKETELAKKQEEAKVAAQKAAAQPVVAEKPAKPAPVAKEPTTKVRKFDNTNTGNQRQPATKPFAQNGKLNSNIGKKPVQKCNHQACGSKTKQAS